MKVAAKQIPVYGSDKKTVIGQLECGDRTVVIGKNDNSTAIAYVVGFIKNESAAGLVDEDAWETAVSAADQFAAYAASREGCLYVWGAQGQTMTKALIKKLEDSDKNFERALKQFEKHVQNGLTLTAYDCSGLVVAYLLEKGLINSDTTANGLFFNHCALIGKEDLKNGDLVFKKYQTKNKMYHVGVYMGDKTVVHAKGRDDGVVREPFSKAGWNRYGRLIAFADSAGTTAHLRLLKVASPMMRGDDVKAVQSALCAKGYNPKGIDGVFGRDTENAVKAFQRAKGLKADGIVGPKTRDKLF
ncbi:MAG: peptidoglycan-binding protein [Christensenellales bacterium]|jgi:hypothetical protein